MANLLETRFEQNNIENVNFRWRMFSHQRRLFLTEGNILLTHGRAHIYYKMLIN